MTSQIKRFIISLVMTAIIYQLCILLWQAHAPILEAINGFVEDTAIFLTKELMKLTGAG